MLWGYYQTNDSEFGFGDSILRLINPNGAANGNLAGAKPQTVCAMIYVFDESQEMGECCGCPLSSTQLATFSAHQNLTSNRSIANDFETVTCASNACGSLAIVAAAQNPGLIAVGSNSNGQGCAITQSGACNVGCDPTNTPSYSVTTANNLLGSITHDQNTDPKAPRGRLSEVALFDDAGGDPTNLAYLQTQCGALVGNGTGGGICNCPTE